MTETRRRFLLAGAALGVLSACGPSTTVDNATGDGAGSSGNQTAGNGAGPAPIPSPGPGPTPTPSPAGPSVRHNVASPEGQAMLAIYAEAVAQMMALPETDPRSWTFQWYTHFVRDDRGKTAEIARVFGSTPSPQRDLALQMWSSCQAHGPNEDESFFLPWHRMYVLAFEGIVRSLTGRSDFTLPYWSYTDPDQRAIPAQFRRPGDPTWGALYRADRNPGVNAGQPIAQAADLSPDVLGETVYAPAGADQGFCANLDGGLHGAVHVSVGDATRGMGSIAWAANDPIFWLHHCNIDRLWASWNASGGENPSDAAFLAKPFVFADGAGAKRVFTVGQVMSTAALGYGYDALIGPDGSALPQTQSQTEALTMSPPPASGAGATPPPVGSAAPRMLLRSAPARPVAPKVAPAVTHVAEGVRLSGSFVRARLAPAAAAPEAAARAMSAMTGPPVRARKAAEAAAARPAPRTPLDMLKAPAPPVVRATAPPPPAASSSGAALVTLKPGQRVFVVIDQLSADVAPGVIYQVYLEAPRPGGGVDAYPIGALNFFSAMPGMAMPGTRHARSYEITKLAMTLSKQGRFDSRPQLSFAPKGRPSASAQPLIGLITLTIQ